MTWKECKQPAGCIPSTWSDADKQVELEFPPPDREQEENAQACCEANANVEDVQPGCLEDCARAACNFVLEDLKNKLASSPPFGCGQTCAENRAETLSTWIAFVEENYDQCLEVATTPGTFLQFPDPPSVPAFGSGHDAKLTLDCTLNMQEDPFIDASSCEASFNEPPETAATQWSYGLTGTVTYDGTEGTDSTPLTGTVVLRRGDCVSDPCWFSIESLELEADNFSSGGYVGRDMQASLAWQGFGAYDSTTNTGEIGKLMFGLDVTLDGQTPSEPLRSYAFTMTNDTANAVFTLREGFFRIESAIFGWNDHELEISTNLASCTPVSSLSKDPSSREPSASDRIEENRGCGCSQSNTAPQHAMLLLLGVLGLGARRKRRGSPAAP
jgi:MYXO-CTERM domain-containing protein